MITYEDCIGISGLTEDEAAAIAHHEHISEMVAVEYGAYLIQTPEGELALKAIILDDIEEARLRGDTVEAAKLRLVLQKFCKNHRIAA